MSAISGFDYRTDKPVKKTKKEWRAEVRAAIAAGGIRRVVEGETQLTLPVTTDLGPPAGKRVTQVLAVEIYANIPA
jgi:hypothetical protein